MTHLRILLTLAFLSVATSPPIASAQYPDWPRRATLVLLTTPDGADLPASAREENFPVLVRLNSESFDFRDAKRDGSDVRFSADGRPLAYQIEEWDAATGRAAIWVRIPEIRGHARQQITLHWGKSDAASESNGQAVFNTANGHAVVMHLGDADTAMREEVGTVTPTDAGTAMCAGAIGRGRRFDLGCGIVCGENIAGLPIAAGPCTTEAWLRAEQVNGVVVGWGNEQAQGKVVMSIAAPPHIRMDCYFSNGNVRSASRLPMSQWVHVVHAYRDGHSHIYVNGRLDGVTNEKGSPLNIRNPARMFLGGWYKNYQYVGDLDEVRISSVARSADWVKLAYENQKPNQTLVGTPVQSGSTFAVSPAAVNVNEGQAVTVTAQAGGAEKVSWVLRRGATETVVSTDRFSYTFAAGRVTKDESCVLQFKAIYPEGVKTKAVPLTIRESIPEPQFALRAPASWNGRDTIEVVPQIDNLPAMQAAGAGELRYRWDVSGGAVIQHVADDRLILKRSQYTGPIRVTATLDNGGATIAQTAEIEVTEPKNDPWVHRAPEPNERPQEGQFYARDDRNEGTLHYNGALDQPADSVFLQVYADDKPVTKATQKLGADKQYALTAKLKPGLVKYRIEFGSSTGGVEKVLDTVGDLVCGDAYLIDGQSNALATDTREESPRETQTWIRSYGGPTGRGDGNPWLRARLQQSEKTGKPLNLWCLPVWKRNQPEQEAELGWWGMELAKRLVAEHQVPIFILNGAVGGTRIDEHQPPSALGGDRADLNTIYGRMLWRLQQARLTHGIRAVLWHQGESDQGAAGPTGGYGWEDYQRFFVNLSAAWKEDLPNVRHYYTFQIWPNACAMGGREGSGDRLREVQRTLPRLYSNMSLMSTLGIQPPGGCHYPLVGWSEFARLIQPQIDRDFYGKQPAGPITPPNLLRASYTTATQEELALEFDQPVKWDESLASQFYLDDAAGEVASGRVAEHVVTLKLKGPSVAQRITYLRERDWSQSRLLWGTNGLAALSFCEVTIEASSTR